VPKGGEVELTVEFSLELVKLAMVQNVSIHVRDVDSASPSSTVVITTSVAIFQASPMQRPMRSRLLSSSSSPSIMPPLTLPAAATHAPGSLIVPTAAEGPTVLNPPPTLHRSESDGLRSTSATPFVPPPLSTSTSAASMDAANSAIAGAEPSSSSFPVEETVQETPEASVEDVPPAAVSTTSAGHIKSSSHGGPRLMLRGCTPLTCLGGSGVEVLPTSGTTAVSPLSTAPPPMFLSYAQIASGRPLSSVPARSSTPTPGSASGSMGSNLMSPLPSASTGAATQPQQSSERYELYLGQFSVSNSPSYREFTIDNTSNVPVDFRLSYLHETDKVKHIIS